MGRVSLRWADQCRHRRVERGRDAVHRADGWDAPAHGMDVDAVSRPDGLEGPREKVEWGDACRLHDREVTAVDGGDLGAAEPLGGRDHRSIDCPQR